MKQCYYHQLNNCNDFQYWLTEKLAPVILSAKPAELLCFSKDDEKGRLRVEMIQHWIDRIPTLGYRVFNRQNGRTKILFYHQEKLKNTLLDKRNRKFLLEQGYPIEEDLEAYLDQLVSKMSLGSVPHEIGVFLGYPLKDVLGYMGHPSLKLTKVNGWKVYGNPRVSDQIYLGIVKAKELIRKQLHVKKPEKVILELIG